MDREIQIIPAAEAGSELEKKLRDWFEEEFGRADRWAEPDYYLTLSVEGQLAGRLAVFDRQVSVGGEIAKVSGIGGVATKGEFRHRGVASALLSRAAEFMRDHLGVEFGFLLCRHEVSPVYAKLGWMRVPAPTTFARAGATATYPHDTMIPRLARKEWPPGAIAMLGLPWSLRGVLMSDANSPGLKTLGQYVAVRRASVADAAGISAIWEQIVVERQHSAVARAWSPAEQSAYFTRLSARGCIRRRSGRTRCRFPDSRSVGELSVVHGPRRPAWHLPAS